VPEVEAKAQLMMPPTPILKDNNWPLLTVTKGFFENLAQGAASSPSSPMKPTSGLYVNSNMIFWLPPLNVSVPSAFAARMHYFTQTNSALPHPAKSMHRCISMACNMGSKQQQRHSYGPRPELHSLCAKDRTRPAATSKDEAMAVMEEEDLDAVAEAWGGEDEDLIPGAPTEGLDEEMEGFEEAGANGEEDEEGGWDMEVSCHIYT